MKWAEPMMTEDEAWAFVVKSIRDLGLLVDGQIPDHLVVAAKAHAAMLSRKRPYAYEDATPPTEAPKEG